MILHELISWVQKQMMHFRIQMELKLLWKELDKEAGI